MPVIFMFLPKLQDKLAREYLKYVHSELKYSRFPRPIPYLHFNIPSRDRDIATRVGKRGCINKYHLFQRTFELDCTSHMFDLGSARF
jgi:hypothetical protein